MSPKVRFQILLEPEQLEQLRALERAPGGAPVARQIRDAVDAWLQQKGAEKKSERGTRRKRGQRS